MAYQQFDLSGAAGSDVSSPALALAAGEAAQVRFTSFNADKAWFEATRNGVTSREVVSDTLSDLCTIMGPASVVLGVRIGAAGQRVAGILEGV